MRIRAKVRLGGDTAVGLVAGEKPLPEMPGRTSQWGGAPLNWRALAAGWLISLMATG